jgi:VIT1/CCC1 family predicted Fe2+/Mn2+ transporter
MQETATTGRQPAEGGVLAGVRREMGDIIRNAPRSKPINTYSVLALMFLLSGFVFVTLGLLDLIAFALRGNSYAWILAFGIVGAVWFIIGAVFAVAVAIDVAQEHSRAGQRTGDVRRAA